MKAKLLLIAAIFALGMLASNLWAVDVYNYKNLSGAVWHQQDLYVTINSFTDEWKNVVGKNWYMTMTVENRGDEAADFNATQIEINDSKGTRFMARPLPGVSPNEMKQSIGPHGSAQFRVMFDGHIFFDRRTPAHLKYTLDTKVDIIK
jgi:hypothetical protein